jgi:hypothetical protein
MTRTDRKKAFVTRDERAALQQSMPNMRVGRARTPVTGVSETGTGPIPKSDDGRDSDPGVQPIHEPDEVTPPAVDPDELRAQADRDRADAEDKSN